MVIIPSYTKSEQKDDLPLSFTKVALGALGIAGKDCHRAFLPGYG